MIIDTVEGDLISLFKSGDGHLIHGCNCFHTMGKGVAKQIAREFPQALEADKMTMHGCLSKLARSPAGSTYLREVLSTE